MRCVATVSVVTLLVAGLGTPRAEAAFPGEDGRIAFERLATVDGQRTMQIFSVAADGSGRRRLTTAPGSAGDPAWSPEGRRIAYTHATSDARDIWVMTADGRGHTNLTNTPEIDEHSPFWSPDGLRLGYLRDGELVLMDADGGGAAAIPAPDDALASPVWSPTGERIAVSAPAPDDDLARVIWTLEADGSDALQITVPGDEQLSGEDLHRAPAWSPDGMRIAYLDGQEFLDCTDDIVMITDADGGDAEAVHEGSCQMTDLAWSPDGDELAFDLYESEIFDEQEEAERHIFRIGVDGAGLTRVTGPNPDAVDRHLDWQPLPDPIGSACPDESVPPTGFSDIAASAHRRAIACAAWYDVARGFVDGTFRPSARVTRAQMASFIARTLTASGATLPVVGIPAFDDIEGHDHAEAITQLATIGVVQGRTDGTYRPARPVTRAQTASLVARAAEWRLERSLPTVPDAFPDDDGNAHEDGINQVAAVGITTGVTVTAFAPAADVRRDQMASFLVRLLDRFGEAGLLTG